MKQRRGNNGVLKGVGFTQELCGAHCARKPGLTRAVNDVCHPCSEVVDPLLG